MDHFFMIAQNYNHAYKIVVTVVAVIVIWYVVSRVRRHLNRKKQVSQI